MEEEPRLDDKYEDGVWYDEMNGDFCEIQESEDGELVELVNPENGNVYWDMTPDEWLNEQTDFRKVSDLAVEDPTVIINRAIRMMARNDINELASVPMDFSVDVRYARQQVDVSAKNE